ncbi:right-handed parallel beta-helix repeat-containing protein [Opitutaceae bacterium TAV4]|nr:right-handed parallel beta-helix repeat-containing protein [Opitutaceae bacterium TAV4]RRJ99953.1 right-handed parallel beta-helix repeat-containing protein [Opitutaceae bacterium TAV3]
MTPLHRTLLILTAITALHHTTTTAATLALNTTPGADNTAAFQAALNRAGDASDKKTDARLHVPPGEWRTGTLRIPANITLTFDPKARLIPIPEKITDDKTLIVVTGDRVRIEGLHHDFAWNGATERTTPVQKLIHADGVNDLIVTGAHVENSDPRKLLPLAERARKGRFFNPDGSKKYTHLGSYNNQRLLVATNSRNVVLENSTGSRLHAMLAAINCANVTARGNRMITGNNLSSFSMGTENFRHHDNWSRDVKYQVSWFGGSPDPSRKAPEVPLGSATKAYRDIKPDAPGWNKHTSGSFDVLIQNNYAEYGNTLAWGNKGRQVVIDGNIARFISDYAYGTEGGENLIFSNNISINSTAGGIVSMYWGEKLLITGNQIIVRHEPWDAEFSWWDSPAKYLGPFIRLHHGPANKEDRYGAGSVHIDGNLFVSELTERSTAITIQRGRDITISGNKFINGRIDKVDQGRLTVMGNEFVSRLPFEDLILNVKGRADTVLVKDNILRREAPIETDAADTTAAEARKTAEAQAIPYLLFTDEDDKAKATGTETATIVKGDSPAIVLNPNNTLFAFVQGNFIYGWKDALSVQSAKTNRAPLSLIVTGNTTDGNLPSGSATGVKIENNTKLPPGLMPR